MSRKCGVVNYDSPKFGTVGISLSVHCDLVTSSAPIPDPDLLALGIAVATARQQRGLSVDSLANAAGLDRKTIMRLERGEHSSSVTVLHAISHVLEIPLGELVESVCESHPPMGGLGLLGD